MGHRFGGNPRLAAGRTVRLLGGVCLESRFRETSGPSRGAKGQSCVSPRGCDGPLGSGAVHGDDRGGRGAVARRCRDASPCMALLRAPRQRAAPGIAAHGPASSRRPGQTLRPIRFHNPGARISTTRTTHSAAPRSVASRFMRALRGSERLRALTVRGPPPSSGCPLRPPPASGADLPPVPPIDEGGA